MKLRYVKRNAAESAGEPSVLEVRWDGTARERMDLGMASLGYEYDGVLEEALPERCFPSGGLELLEPERPTPAARSVRLVPVKPKWSGADGPVGVHHVSGLERLFLVIVPVVALILAAGALQSDLAASDLAWFYEVTTRGTLPLLRGEPSGFLSKLVGIGLFTLFGPHRVPFYLLAFILHIANVAMIQAALKRITDKPAVSALLAAAWALAPFQASALGSLAHHGQVLAATFFSLLLLAITRSRRVPRSVASRAILGTLYGLLAAASFDWSSLAALPQDPAPVAYLSSLLGVAALSTLAARLPLHRSGAPWVEPAALALIIAATVLVRTSAEPARARGRVDREQLWTALGGLAQLSSAQAEGEELYVRNAPTLAYVPHLPPESFPGIAALYAISTRFRADDGLRVRFVEKDAGLVARVRASRRRGFAELLVSEAEAERRGAKILPFPVPERGDEPPTKAQGRRRFQDL